MAATPSFDPEDSSGAGFSSNSPATGSPQASMFSSCPSLSHQVGTRTADGITMLDDCKAVANKAPAEVHAIDLNKAQEPY